MEEQEFAECRKAAAANGGSRRQAAPSRPGQPQPSSDGFMDITDGYRDELPFRN